MALILVRYVGEIGIKGKNRTFFVKRLRHNLRSALKRSEIPGRVWSEGQRVYVEVNDEMRQLALVTLQRVFGVASLSPVQHIASDINEICAEAVALARRVDLGPSASYRIKTRRADKSFPYPSPEVNRIVGTAVGQVTQARVDLTDHADLTVGVEIRREGTFVYGQVFPGPGGMPVNTQGRAFALLSGGIDSPVAMWQMMRRGCGIIPLHFAQSEIEKQKAMEHCRVLGRWSFGWDIKPIVLDHHQIVEPIADRLRQIKEERWTCIFCKRAMIATAAELAPRYRVQALIMGDSLGQVASQTLDNLVAISWQASLPILRPLIATDKTQIIDLAQRIGTYDVSIQESAPCPFLPAHPLTRASLEHLAEIVAQLA
jgi:thiamine biosynthesis protein ThiI